MAEQKQNALKVLEQQIQQAEGVRGALILAQDRYVKNYELVTGKKDGAQRFESEVFNFLDIVAEKPDLQKADKFSIFGAIMKSAITGLSFKSEGHLYPMAVKAGDKTVVKVQIGAHGKREMLRMMPEIKAVDEAVIVSKGDHFVHDKLNKIVKEHYTTKDSSTRNNIDDVFAAYCRVEWKDGRIKDVVIYQEELKKAKSKSKNQGDYSVWNEWPLEMCKKVTYHRAKKLYHRYPEGVVDFGRDASDNADPTEDITHTVMTESEPPEENVDQDTGEVVTAEVVEEKKDTKSKKNTAQGEQQSFI